MSGPSQIIPPVQTPPSATDLARNRRWYPKKFDDDELDLAIKTAYTSLAGLEHKTPQTIDALDGSSVSHGALAVLGSAKAVATGLRTLSNIVVSIDNGATPTNIIVTATPSTTVAGAFDVFCWQPTAAGNTAPTVATASVNIRWHAWGTQ